MENFVSLLVTVVLVFLFLRMMALPIRLFWKITINSLGGFVCLWLLNSVSGFTGVWFPINAVTALTAGFLGLPGIGLLALVQFIL